MKFEIEQTSNRGTNKAKVELFNLSPLQRGVLEQPGAFLTITAGYVGNVGLLFQGSIAKQGVSTKLVPPNRITTVTAGEGELEIQGTEIRESFGAGVTNRQIIERVAALMGLGIKDAALIPLLTYGLGQAYASRADLVLDQIVRDIGAAWSIQAGQIQILTGEQATTDDVILIRKDSGLIGAAAPTKDAVEFTSLLQPPLRPGRKVQVESLDVTGLFRLDEIKHTGDYRATPWFSRCKATAVKGAQ
jgi:hypothetical protein